MLRIDAEAVAAVASTVPRPYYAQWSNDGGQSWTDAAIAAGSAQVSADRTADVRYQASATLVGVPTGRRGINAVATQVRLWQGLQPSRRGVAWFPAGRYTVTDTTRTRTGVAVSLDGLEDVIRSAEFVASRTLGPDSASTLVETLVGEALPGVPISWRPGVEPGTLIPQIVADSDRWAVLSSASDSGSGGIVQALAGEVYADARGIIVVAPVPSLSDPVVWRVARGRGGALVSVEAKQSADGLANVVSVTGDAGTGDTTIGPAYAWDDDPNSLTYAGPDPVGDPLAPQRLGLAGVRPRVARITSSLVQTVTQAQGMAAAELANRLGVQASVSFTAACNPASEPGDVVEVEVDPGVWERHIIDGLSYTLGAASMSCTTRTNTRRL